MEDNGETGIAGYRELNTSDSDVETEMFVHNVSPPSNLLVTAQKLSPPTPFADSKPQNCCYSNVKQKVKTDKIIEETELSLSIPPSLSTRKGLELPLSNSSVHKGVKTFTCSNSEHSGHIKSGSFSRDSEFQCKSLKKSGSMKSNLDKWHFSTLPRKNIHSVPCGKNKENNQEDEKDDPPDVTQLSKSKTFNSNISIGILDAMPVLPPPSSFKTVHFAPNVPEGDISATSIPTEGLPRGPASVTIDLLHLEGRVKPSVPSQRDSAVTSGLDSKTENQVNGSANDKCDFILPASEVVPIKLPVLDKMINIK